MVKTKPALSTWLADTARHEQADLVSAAQARGIDPSRLLILCARGDEASRWLRAWDVVAKAPFIIGCVLLSIVEASSRLNLPIIVDRLARSTFHRGLDEIRVLGFDGWSLTVGSIILCLIWGVVLIFSSVIRWPGYWREPLLGNVLVEIGTDSVPRTGANKAHERPGVPVSIWK